MKLKNIFVFVLAICTTGIAQTNEKAIPPDASIYGFQTGGFVQSPQLTFFESTPINDKRIYPSTNTTQSEMSIAINPLNNQIILASANVSSYPEIIIYGTGVYWSTNGGSTWNGSDQPPIGSNRGDPAAVIDRDGYFYVGSIAPNYGQGILKSTDNGLNWNYIQVADPSIPNNINYILDKNHLTVDNNASGAYSGYLYSAWSDFSQSDRAITITRSTDQGETWDNEQIISSGFAGSGF